MNHLITVMSKMSKEIFTCGFQSTTNHTFLTINRKYSALVGVHNSTKWHLIICIANTKSSLQIQLILNVRLIYTIQTSFSLSRILTCFIDGYRVKKNNRKCDTVNDLRHNKLMQIEKKNLITLL